MYELYVRMKISKGKKADQDGQIISHDAVKLKIQR